MAYSRFRSSHSYQAHSSAKIWIKTLFILAVTVASGGVAWRWLLVRSERAWIIGYLPAGFGPALERFAN